MYSDNYIMLFLVAGMIRQFNIVNSITVHCMGLSYGHYEYDIIALKEYIGLFNGVTFSVNYGHSLGTLI